MWRGVWALWMGALGALGALAPECPQQVAGERCRVSGPSGDGVYEAVVDGGEVRVVWQPGRSLHVECVSGTRLDSDAMPRLPPGQEVESVKVTNCAAPANVSYAEAIAALGFLPRSRISEALVTGFSNLYIVGRWREHQPTQPQHLLGLERLLRLTLEQRWGGTAPHVDAALIAATLTELVVLRLSHVALIPSTLHALPPSLRELHLVRANVSQVPAAVLRRLPELNTLIVEEHGLGGAWVEVAGAPHLAMLTVRAFRGPLRLEGLMQGNVTRLELVWAEREIPPSPPRWPRPCPLLRLTLKAYSVGAQKEKSAPRLQLDPWVSACDGLRELRVQAPLALLPDTMLTSLRHLEELTLQHCSLQALPAHLLFSAETLRRLDLSHNELSELPSFVGAPKLINVNLSFNKLTSAAMEALGEARSLRVLTLHHNPLGDLCNGSPVSLTGNIWADAESKLKRLKSLENLDLSYTGVNRICRDWRQNMENLKLLDLRHTNISQLTYSELQYRRNREARVHLEGIPLENLQYTYEEYNATKDDVTSDAVTVILEASLQCDCRQYWAARALRERKSGVRLQRLKCGDRPFTEVSLDTLTCPVSELCPALPEDCRCVQRPDTRPPGSLVRLQCENSGLEEVPEVTRNLDHAWALHLAGNRISSLRPSQLPPVLEEVDLRNNSIERVEPAVVAALSDAGTTRLRLDGNELACTCAEHRALSVLQRAGSFVDFFSATCVGGAPLRVPEPCAPWEWIAGAVALAALAMFAALGVWLTRPEGRLWLKVMLARIGWLPSRGEELGLRFDAFVSYAHQDEEVAHELAKRLESGRAPLRLCLHERDWAPGGWIPAQIAASVRSSRCTIALVSEHYVRSGWARAEFREAHAAALRDARPRLVVVLLAPADQLPLDAELRAYLAANTYVRWGDPWFWSKLRVALHPHAPTRPEPAELCPATEKERSTFFGLPGCRGWR